MNDFTAPISCFDAIQLAAEKESNCKSFALFDPSNESLETEVKMTQITIAVEAIFNRLVSEVSYNSYFRDDARREVGARAQQARRTGPLERSATVPSRRTKEFSEGLDLKLRGGRRSSFFLGLP